jgi:hypothetical protein
MEKTKIKSFIIFYFFLQNLIFKNFNFFVSAVIREEGHHQGHHSEKAQAPGKET